MLPSVKTALVIVGPTASGKTSLSLQAALKHKTAIISADSRQCYLEMNIGVAKPSPAELSLVPHYFINSHSIHEPVDAVVFEQVALQAAEEIFSVGNIAVVTGGTGLYVKVFCEGIDDIPPVDPSIKESVAAVFREQGVPGLQQWLTEIDPEFMQASTETSNRARLMRALEVKLSSGSSILAFRAGVKKERPFLIQKYGVQWPREMLNKRINDRVDTMISAGLVQEATTLYPLRHLKALQTVGYQEIFSYLDGLFSLDEAVEKIKQHTRNYAKRQLTWFRHDPDIHWIMLPEGLQEAAVAIKNFLKPGIN
jgi:tRNA dimethylallyltransferase